MRRLRAPRSRAAGCRPPGRSDRPAELLALYRVHHGRAEDALGGADISAQMVRRPAARHPTLGAGSCRYRAAQNWIRNPGRFEVSRRLQGEELRVSPAFRQRGHLIPLVNRVNEVIAGAAVTRHTGYSWKPSSIMEVRPVGEPFEQYTRVTAQRRPR